MLSSRKVFPDSDLTHITSFNEIRILAQSWDIKLAQKTSKLWRKRIRQAFYNSSAKGRSPANCDASRASFL